MKDAYRWAFIPWLVDACRANHVRSLCILGDLTDAKDNHPATLINSVVDAVLALKAACVDLYILEGNHDYLVHGAPTFGFLARFPGVHYIGSPRDVSGSADDEAAAFMLPHSKHPAQDWQGLDFTHYDLVFLHQTVSGAIASNGQRMDGETLPSLAAAGKVYSGDIHVPQRIGVVEYVGSPYHVHFGDSFIPRCVLLRRGAPAVDLHFESPRRVMLTVDGLQDPKLVGMVAGDHVKLRIRLHPSEHHEWLSIKARALDLLKRRGVECHGIELVSSVARKRLQPAGRRRVLLSASPEQQVMAHVAAEEWGGDALDMGLELL